MRHAAEPARIASRIISRYPLFFYLSGTALITVAVATLLQIVCPAHRSSKLGGRGTVTAGIALCGSPGDRRVELAGHDFRATVPPAAHGFQLRDSRTPSHRSSRCRPCFRISKVSQELLENLEVRYLANRDENLHFALLTDFRDAKTEVVDGDEELVAAAREGIEALNPEISSAPA